MTYSNLDQENRKVSARQNFQSQDEGWWWVPEPTQEIMGLTIGDCGGMGISPYARDGEGSDS
ncbi:MAG: hypothetical protein C4545_04730 [Anaerolineaceae bacterium]|jgi:hypothetical protein|nr:MAG: hypothetical protein C4545_04730 [Anaerolineaceae bacterium]